MNSIDVANDPNHNNNQHPIPIAYKNQITTLFMHKQFGANLSIH